MKWKRYFLFLWNFWPPFLGAGIHIYQISDDLFKVRVELKRRPWNRNIVGTQFGGSIYAMTDPFYMALLVIHLGPDFIVWDKGAKIDFKKPGRTKLFADFDVDQKLLDEVRLRAKMNGKHIFELPVEVKDASGVIVASVQKTLYVRYKGL